MVALCLTEQLAGTVMPNVAGRVEPIEWFLRRGGWRCACRLSVVIPLSGFARRCKGLRNNRGRRVFQHRAKSQAGCDDPPSGMIAG